MNAFKFLRFVKYFTFLTFLLSSVIIALIYFLPTHSLVDFSVLYGLAFLGMTLVLLSIVVYKFIMQKGNRLKFLPASILLILNLVIAIGYYIIWNYALGTILVK